MSEFNLHNLREEHLAINFLQSLITIFFCLIIVIIVALSLFVIEYKEENSSKVRIEYVTGYYSGILNVSDQNSLRIEHKITLLKNLYYRKWKMVNLLNDIHQIFSNDINLNKLQIKNSSIVFEGASSSPISIANMLILLHNSRVLFNPVLISNEHDHFIVNVNVA